MSRQTNKRVGRKPKQGLGAIDAEDIDASEALRLKERALKKKVHRMRVEMVARRLGFPIGTQPDMIRAKAAAARKRFLLQVVEFVVTAILIGGACAWLYQWWLSRQ
jgi:hypothetical protein